MDKPELRIIDVDLAERVDAVRGEKRDRYFASIAKSGRVPERAHGKYLLSGGMLGCAECGANFEARIAPWHGHREVYICSTRRRKPGVCSSTLTLPIAETDNAVLQEVIDEALGTRYADELLMMIETVPDETGRLTAERDRLRKELNNPVESIALLGTNATTVGPKVKEREADLAKVEAALRRPRPARPDVEKVRTALMQRAGEWREVLRSTVDPDTKEPKLARLLLRRMLGSLTISGAERPAFVKWDADVKPGILEGIVATDLVASPAISALSAAYREYATLPPTMV